MRKEYGQALRALFTAEMQSRLPQFEPSQVKSKYLFPGERVFCWNPQESIRCWIILQPNLKGHESFSVEIGWSKLARFPELSMRPSFSSPSEDRAEFDEPEYVCRLGKDRLGEDYWAEVEAFRCGLTEAECMAILQEQLRPIPPEEAKAKVQPHVVDAVDRLVRFGVPYLEQFAASCADRVGRGGR